MRRARMRKLALLLSLLALGALGLVVFEGGDDDQTTAVVFEEGDDDQTTAVSEAETAGERYQDLRPYYGSPEQKIERSGNAWAALFAAGGPGDHCGYMTQPACERIACERAGGSTIRNCTPPSAEFRRSFEGATVEDVIAIEGKQAAARFSNGETVVLFDASGVWLIKRVGWNEAAELSPELVQELKRGRGEQVQELRRAANDWASLFATYKCNRYMGEPICGRMGPVSAAYQKSFAEATVEDIEFKGVEVIPVGHIYLATVKFSNGEAVVFQLVPWARGCAGPGSGCAWNVAEPDQNRRFLQAATTPR
jgi:hypothetical protein